MARSERNKNPETRAKRRLKIIADTPGRVNIETMYQLLNSVYGRNSLRRDTLQEVPLQVENSSKK